MGAEHTVPMPISKQDFNQTKIKKDPWLFINTSKFLLISHGYGRGRLAENSDIILNLIREARN